MVYTKNLGTRKMEKLRKEAREKEAKEQRAAKTKDNNNAKRAQAMAKGIVEGSAILVRLRQEGQSLLNRLRIDDLMALLQNAQPQTVVKKDTKAVPLKKVSVSQSRQPCRMLSLLQRHRQPLLLLLPLPLPLPPLPPLSPSSLHLLVL